MFPVDRNAALAVAAVVVGLLGACGKVDSPTAEARGVQKANAYIACFNAVGQPILDSFAQYTGWMQDAEAGPTGRETQVRGPGTVLAHHAKPCAAPMVAALAMVPADPHLDAPARAYQASFEDLYGVIEQADRYYQREDYRQDNGVGMRGHHAPLMQAYGAFFAAARAMNAALEKREDDSRMAQLKAIEAAEGRSLAYHRLRIVSEGQQLTRLLAADAPDLDGARTQLTAFQAQLRQAQDDTVGNGDAMWGQVVRAADALERDAQRRIERVQTGTPPTRGGQRVMQGSSQPDNLQGSAEAVMASYNDLAEMSNRTTH